MYGNCICLYSMYHGLKVMSAHLSSQSFTGSSSRWAASLLSARKESRSLHLTWKQPFQEWDAQPKPQPSPITAPTPPSPRHVASLEPCASPSERCSFFDSVLDDLQTPPFPLNALR